MTFVSKHDFFRLKMFWQLSKYWSKIKYIASYQNPSQKSHVCQKTSHPTTWELIILKVIKKSLGGGHVKPIINTTSYFFV